MVDFKKLLAEKKEKDRKFGRDITVKDEKLFKELHEQFCSGEFVVDRDHGSLIDYSCSECSATIQKGTDKPQRWNKYYEEDRSNYFYGTLPEKCLQQHGLFEKAQGQ